MKTDVIVIVGAARTPMGSLQGTLASITAPQLGAVAIKAALERAKILPQMIDEVVMGCVLSAGLGQAPARQAGMYADLPVSTGATTVNKMCGSGMKAVMLAHDQLVVGDHKIMVAGGMESMTGAPYLLEQARGGYRLGHAQMKDHMFLDGLEDAYDKGRLMGFFAEVTAEKYNFTREAQDAYATTSLERARQAVLDGIFSLECAPVTTTQGVVSQDEQPFKAKLEKIPLLKPAFKPNGTVTAANSSSISDGAAVLLLARRTVAEMMDLQPLATIVAHITHSQEPSQFSTAPVGAIHKLLEKINWPIETVDLFEINEAFAVVTMAAMKDLNLPRDKVNIHGGACALGHPIGASGARIIVTLLYALQKYQLKRGIAALCIGGGEATAIAIELI